MKKLHLLSLAALLAFTATTLVSCDNDDGIASTLWGVWEGNMYVTSEWNGHTYKATSSVIQFDKNPYDYASGTGYWVDYYSGAPWDYFASHINWRVVNERIQIHSLEDNTYFNIYDYSLSNNYFSGVLINEYGDRLTFRLRKTASPYWDGFDWGWDSWYGYSLAGRSTDATPANLPVRRVVK